MDKSHAFMTEVLADQRARQRRWLTALRGTVDEARRWPVQLPDLTPHEAGGVEAAWRDQIDAAVSEVQATQFMEDLVLKWQAIATKKAMSASSIFDRAQGADLPGAFEDSVNSAAYVNSEIQLTSRHFALLHLLECADQLAAVADGNTQTPAPRTENHS